MNDLAGPMIKEITLIKLASPGPQQPWPVPDFSAHADQAGFLPVRHVLNRAVGSTDPQAVGAAAPYEFVAETWLTAPTDRVLVTRGTSWFNRLYPDAADDVDHLRSLVIHVREVLLRPPPKGGGVKIISMLKRNPDKNFEAFLAYWKDHHGPIVQQAYEFWRHIRGYVQNHPLREGAQTLSGDVADGFDGITQLWFDDDAAAVAAFREPRYLELVKPDELVLRIGAPLRLVAEEVVDIRRAP
jgi:uncharacterized protein (TIGR02118 family)